MNKQVVITDSYMLSVSKLNNQERKQAANTVKQMHDDITIPSLSVHAIDREKCDAKFRSARVNSDLRIIFMNEGEFCTLLYIDHHDAAYDWCVGKYFKKTDFGASYIYDVLYEEQVINKVQESIEYENEAPILEGKITKKNLMKLGISEIHATNLLAVNSEDIFMEYISIFPEEMQEALFDIYTETKDFESVYNELLLVSLEQNTEKVDCGESLLHKDSKRRFYVTQSMEELEYLMENEDFEKWTTFLHPSQENLVTVDRQGPILVEGGPGTGKTVLGMHRAVYLSQNVYTQEDGKKVLFCTFSKKLAKSISNKLDNLYQQKNVKNNTDVLGVDSFIHQQLINNGVDMQANQERFEQIFKQIYNTKHWNHDFTFYEYEHKQIIERYGILTSEQYVNANRTGMGTPLNKNQRLEVWEFFKALFKKQKELGVVTYINKAEKLESLLDSGKVEPMYDAIIIDEAQDLEPAKLRLLNKCVKNKNNSMLILSDHNQRIYNLLSWKGDTNINVVGRSYHLNINYRTTKEISEYASLFFFKGKEKTDYMKSYKSIVKGNDPIVKGFVDEEKQWNSIIATIRDLKNKGIPLNKVCVVFPSKTEKNKLENRLLEDGINCLYLEKDIIPEEADADTVCLCLTKGIKGLEFIYVILASSEKVGKSLEGKFLVDDLAKELYKKQTDCERYVAATRARDSLLVTYVEE